jgi:sulfide dehydrogenase [flavocytochrome c] flavoprotein chain
VGVMRRRTFLGLTALAVAAPWRPTRAGRTPRARIAIIGGGFAGSCCALRLRELNPHLEITLIDADARYVTCPMSNAVLVGLRSMDFITRTRAAAARAGIHFVHALVTGIDGARHTLRLESGRTLAYDKLVVAPGIRLLFGTPQGYDLSAARLLPHAWQAGAQTALLAAQLRALDNGATVAICVPAGLMRCPPGPYERAGLIADWLQRRRARCKVLIFDANNHFPRQDVFQAAWQESYPGMIEWIPSTEGGAVERVEASTRTLVSARGRERVALANVIPPQAPGQLAVDAGLATGHGWCPVHPASFESERVSDVHVIGDACIAGAMPKAASAAASQARQCAAAIAAQLDGRATPAAQLDSVCYSFVTPSRAFAIRGAFALSDGDIRARGDARAAADAPPSPALAAEAMRWYIELCRSCFGAGPEATHTSPLT